MPINNRESNAPENMLPWVRELEQKLSDIEERLIAVESAIRTRR